MFDRCAPMSARLHPRALWPVMKAMTELARPTGAISRRSFLALAAGAAFAAPRSLVIDAHVHVWTNETSAFPFAHPYDPKFKPPAVAGTAELLLEEMDQHAIDAAVLVQVIYYGWDNRYLAQCVKRHPQRFRAQGLI